MCVRAAVLKQGLEYSPCWVGEDRLLTFYPSPDFPEKSERILYSQRTLSDGRKGKTERVCVWPILISGDVVNVERVTKSSRLDADLHHCLAQ